MIIASGYAMLKSSLTWWRTGARKLDWKGYGAGARSSIKQPCNYASKLMLN